MSLLPAHLPLGEEHDRMDAGGRTTRKAKTEDEGAKKPKPYLYLFKSRPNPIPEVEGIKQAAVFLGVLEER